jgi:NADH:ubiquinone oxidoreductase subunit 5 (subunit L)/multisubunit Na+/H+ antiporter MnhA subunit
LSQVGLIFIIFSLGFYYYSFLYLLNHALFKSIIFLIVGIKIFYEKGNQDSRFNKNFFFYRVFIILFMRIISIISLFFSRGIFIKEYFLEFFFSSNLIDIFIFLRIIIFVLTNYYSLKIFIFFFSFFILQKIRLSFFGIFSFFFLSFFRYFFMLFLVRNFFLLKSNFFIGIFFIYFIFLIMYFFINLIFFFLKKNILSDYFFSIFVSFFFTLLFGDFFLFFFQKIVNFFYFYLIKIKKILLFIKVIFLIIVFLLV